MFMRLIISLFILGVFSNPFIVLAQKTPLSFEDYDTWKTMGKSVLTNDGSYLLYEINPLTFGDANLVIHQITTGNNDTLYRTDLLKTDPQSAYYVGKTHVPYDTIKSLILKKVPKKKHPSDTLIIVPFEKDTVYRFTEYKQILLPEKEGTGLAISLKNYTPAKSETPEAKRSFFQKLFSKKNKATPAEKKKKNKSPHLISLIPTLGEEVYHGQAEDFTLSDYNSKLGFIQAFGDSIDSCGVFVYNQNTRSTDTLYFGEGSAQSITSDRKGVQWAYMLSKDTGDVKNYALHYTRADYFQTAADTLSAGMPKGYAPSKNGRLRFSKDGTRLFFGVAERAIEEPEDTLIAKEEPKVDVWNYKDDQLQPRQLLQRKRDEKKTMQFVYHIDPDFIVQLENDTIDGIRPLKNGNGRYALASNSKPYEVEYSWAYPWRSDWYRIDLMTGKTDLLIKGHGHNKMLSPDGNYFIWFDANKNDWFSKDLSTDSVINLSQEIRAEGAILVDPENEVPAKSYAYGSYGFTKEKGMLLSTHQHLYLIDYTGRNPAKNLTEFIDLDENTRFSFYNFDREKDYVNLDTTLLLKGFNYKLNQSSLIAIENGEYTILKQADANFYTPNKGDHSSIFTMKQSTYHDYPDLYWFDGANLMSSNIEFQKVSDFQNQREEKLWGYNEKYYWENEQGKQKGLLFYPEDFDSSKTYPLMIYFYEKNFNTEHSYRSFRPSPSTISIPFYNSNGYLVFVPDIHYTTGQPGQDAVDAIVSGALSLAKLPFIDENKMAIQGQSWGGYQVAYLVTQTNMFAAGMAGAPVSNMISAYGGIRWGSGLSRQFQYEQTQSRIGTNLWDGWDKYRDNSPIYHAQNVNTPLLIMHNDNDGAVPWYQGIEMFVGLRRLQKPVWMLNYNGDQHNLMKMANRIDLSKRMFGFFNHYLKGKPQPLWMKEGIPAVDKGKIYGYE